MQEKELDFFLGALSPTGFFSFFAQALPSARTGTAVFLKGGPGCGKSTLLKQSARTLLEDGQTVERIHCAADPQSLDGVLCRARQLAVIDATPPHALEPAYPTAFEEVLALYPCVDRAALRPHQAEIVALFNRHKLQTERAIRCMAAAGSLLQDSMHTAQCCTDSAKARAFAKTLARRYLPCTNGPATEDIRLLSALTPQGVVFYADTIGKLAPTVVALDDAYGAAAQTLWQALRTEALARGHRLITCYCSLFPFEKIEHLLLPDIGVAFVTTNAYHPVQLPAQRTLHASRFTQQEGLRLRRKRLRFNKKAAVALLAQAADSLAEAKRLHDQLEEYYQAALLPGTLDSAGAQLQQWL